MSDRAEVLTQKIKEHVRGNWLHNFEIDSTKEVVVAENIGYRSMVLDRIFSTLFSDRSVLVLDEASGVWPTFVRRAGARYVAACSDNDLTCELIREVVDFLEAPVEVVNSKMVGFYYSEPYVDMRYGGKYEFLLGLGQIWPMFGASGQSFDAVVEACAFVVTDGLVFDWSDVEWAKPPPPLEYNRSEFCRALRKRFEYVMVYSNWLVVAVGKLPSASDETADVS